MFSKLKQKIQWVLFSSTYPDNITNSIERIVKDASSISLKKEKLYPDHIQQFVIQLPNKGKAEFLVEIFQTLSMNQCIIFVNTKDSVESLSNILKIKGFAASIMHSGLQIDERDDMMAKFKNCEVRTFITTNLLARGIYFPEVEFVINYDVPALRNRNGSKSGEAETYLHRIGRAGRFGRKGIAITLLDSDVDKDYFDEIIDHYGMKDKVTVLKNAEHLAEVYQAMTQGDLS